MVLDPALYYVIITSTMYTGSSADRGSPPAQWIFDVKGQAWWCVGTTDRLWLLVSGWVSSPLFCSNTVSHKHVFWHELTLTSQSSSQEVGRSGKAQLKWFVICVDWIFGYTRPERVSFWLHMNTEIDGFQWLIHNILIKTSSNNSCKLKYFIHHYTLTSLEINVKDE